jgi:Tfp pilus assembly protein PilW
MASDRRVSGDHGTTLMELVVGMMIMVIFMGMFTSAVLLMNRLVTKAQAVTATTTQLNQAFLTLDKSVRYASAISTQGKSVTGFWYVELRRPRTDGDYCTQLRVNVTKKSLEQRTWKEGTAPASSFTQMASDIANGTVTGPTQPFTVSATISYQRLAIYLVSTTSGSSSTTTTSSFTFTAINSVVPAPAAICQGYRP